MYATTETSLWSAQEKFEHILSWDLGDDVWPEQLELVDQGSADEPLGGQQLIG